MGEAERGDSAPRTRVSFYCANGHETRPAFAMDAEIPEQWECIRVAGYPPAPISRTRRPRRRTMPYKTHLAYVKERRSDEEAVAILAEALDGLRTPPRQRGEVIY
jgi:hypothetical protein